MKRAFVVSGPESAGNRLVAAVLVSAGCEGEASTTGEWNGAALPDGPSPVVVVRSLPHGGRWPDLAETWTTLRRRGYEVTALLVTRQLAALAESQVRRGHVEDRVRAETRVRDAYRLFFSCLHATGPDVHEGPEWFRWRVVAFEELLLNPLRAPRELCQWCGLGEPRLGELVVDGGAPGPIDTAKNTLQLAGVV